MDSLNNKTSKTIYSLLSVTDNCDPPVRFQPRQWRTRIQTHSHIMCKPLPFYPDSIQAQGCVCMCLDGGRLCGRKSCHKNHISWRQVLHGPSPDDAGLLDCWMRSPWRHLGSDIALAHLMRIKTRKEGGGL